MIALAVNAERGSDSGWFMTDRLIAVFLLLAGTACAQFQTDSSDMVRRLRVRVAFADHAPCDSSMRVVITGAMGFALGEGSVNGECTADFFDVPSGRYRVTVRGSDAMNADDGDVEVNSVVAQDVEVHAKHTEASESLRLASHTAFVSVKELGVPSNAAKEFEKADRLIARQEWAKATEHLQKGLAIYPNYAGGYNNLGAVYHRRGNNVQARQALQQAIALDGHLAAAYVNLGRLNFLEKDYASAEPLLKKAVELETEANADEFLLLAYAQVTDRHFYEAIETSRQGHAMKLDEHGPLHLIAANAYERQNRIVDSVAELQTYLAEEPGGFLAEKVKTAIATLQAQMASQSSVR